MNPIRDLVVGPNAVFVALAALASLIAVLMITSFWPGPIGHDYHITLEEAATWRFAGHQPPTAAVATWLLTFGTANPTIIFVVKVVAYFATLGFLLFGARAPFVVRIGAAVIIFSPAFLYLAPILRNNCLQLVFLGLAVAAGVAKESSWRPAVAGVSLVLAAMFSHAPHLGHAALVVLFLLWQFPQWSLGRTAIVSAASVAALWISVQAANITAGNVERSATLYVSALNGIGGLYDPGEKTCLSSEILRGGASSPEQVYAEHYIHPYVYMPLWTENRGFKLPNDVTPEQRREVINCWFKTIKANPGEFIAERSKLAVIGLRTSPLEPQFVWFRSNGEYIVNPNFNHPYQGLDLNGFARALYGYGNLGNWIRIGSIKPYLGLFLLTALAVLIVTKGRRLFVLFGAMSIFGFMMPQLLFAQHPSFRYYVEAAYLASWLSLMHIWILTTDPLTPPQWLLQIWRSGAKRILPLFHNRPPV